MPYCTNCGKQFPDDAKFCPECGTPVIKGQAQSQEQRKQEYAGEVRKCPNCGEVLDSFMTHCPACGHEIRHIKAASAAQELAQKLEEIELQKMPNEPIQLITPMKFRKQTRQNNDSIMKKALGWDLFEKSRIKHEQEALEDAIRTEHFARMREAKFREDQFERQKARQKVSLISNFPVPNTKEDILEFMLLADTNISLKRGNNHSVSKAWMTKMDQVYQKAEISFNNTSDLERIKEIYSNTKAKIKKARVQRFFLIAIPILLLLTFLSWCSAQANKEEEKTARPIEQSSVSVNPSNKAEKKERDTESIGASDLVDAFLQPFETVFDELVDSVESIVVEVKDISDGLEAAYQSMPNK